MDKAIYLLGGGGHASVLVDMLKHNGIAITAICDPQIDQARKAFSDIAWLDNEDFLFKIDASTIVLVNALGSLPNNAIRKKIFNKFFTQGYRFASVVSKHALISPFATLGHGVQVMPGAIVQTGAQIGDNTIINSGVIVEHDCIIGKHNHIAPGVTLSGEVITGDDVHIGTGAVIIQGISIGDASVIAAGAIITKSIESEKIVFGARANIQDKRQNNES